jgi:hypothetical protein
MSVKFPSNYKIIEVPATLRLMVPIDITDNEKEALVESLLSVAEGTVTEGTMDANIKAHVNMAPENKTLCDKIISSDLWINSVSKSIETHEIS